jgi:hypothetical protein
MTDLGQFALMGRGYPMRSVTDCKHRADECHKLANLAARPENWGHFLEMAQTWEILLRQRQHENQLAETVALLKATPTKIS